MRPGSTGALLSRLDASFGNSSSAAGPVGTVIGVAAVVALVALARVGCWLWPGMPLANVRRYSEISS